MIVFILVFAGNVFAFPDSTSLTYEERAKNYDRFVECRLKLQFIEDIEICVNKRRERAYHRATKKYPDLAALGIIHYPFISFGLSEMHVANCVRYPNENSAKYYKTLEKDLRKVNQCPKKLGEGKK